MDKEDLNLYEIIGVQPDATKEVIRRAYLKLALKLHPDKHAEGNRSEATQAFTRMKNAYDVLIGEKQRKAYDFSRASRETGGHPPFTQNTKPAHESTKGDFFHRQTPSSRRPRQSRQGSEFRHNDTRSGHSSNKSESHSRTSRTQRTRSQGTSSNQQGRTPPRTSRSSHHENQQRTSSSKNSTHHTSSPRQPRVFGVCKNGQSCLRCIQQGRYCYQHVHQEDPTRRRPNTSSSHVKEGVYGIRLDGQPCKRCVKQGGYCHQHESQEKGRREQDSRNGTSFGVCQDGRPCSRCIQQGRYCYQRQYQSASK